VGSILNPNWSTRKGTLTIRNINPAIDDDRKYIEHGFALKDGRVNT
jgi:hypothetical protein